jgi:Xaa-Pro aminopeptidase
MRRLVAVLTVVVCLPAAAQISSEEYRARRAALRKALPDSVLLLTGRTAQETDDDRSGFFQEPNFLYLTGWQEPGAALLITPSTDILFLARRNPVTERYTGRKASADDAGIREKTGFDQVLPYEELESRFAQALETAQNVYTLAAEPYAARVRALAPLRNVADASGTLSRLREKKSPAEIALIEHSVAATAAAHRAAWHRIAPGVYEYQVAASMTFAMLDRGCERNAYAPIVASGPNAIVLHYAENRRRLEAGDIVLMDVGAECAAYAADVTRSVPANGKFTGRQRELYQAVLGAEKAAIAAVKPGALMGTPASTQASLYTVARDYLEAHGGLGKYLTHGVSHHVGLEVHDAPPASYLQPLEAGMVITIEPGVYIPEEGIGIRIEDTVLVTESGVRVLSAAIPTAPGEIEKAMAAR